ncbi:MAG TPA: serine/threonine-protein kinase, partial [Aggregatilineales bacterium]|nr:serine/threonine-protein kinase [Aggregatilineales bacterium]
MQNTIRSSLTPQQVIKGYKILDLIDEGGFGAIYRAHQEIVGREVAIKVILPRYANSPNFIRRFEAEAQLVARLEHLHIVPLYDYWRDPDGAYLVMRWLRGGSVSDSLASEGKWSLSRANRLLEQVASALATAHQSGVVHRDLKPGNILLDEQSNAYLADFGIALYHQEEDADEDSMVGSPAYIYPEQITGAPVTPFSDQYSLGIVMYQL